MTSFYLYNTTLLKIKIQKLVIFHELLVKLGGEFHIGRVARGVQILKLISSFLLGKERRPIHSTFAPRASCKHPLVTPSSTRTYRRLSMLINCTPQPHSVWPLLKCSPGREQICKCEVGLCTAKIQFF